MQAISRNKKILSNDIFGYTYLANTGSSRIGFDAYKEALPMAVGRTKPDFILLYGLDTEIPNIRNFLRKPILDGYKIDTTYKSVQRLIWVKNL